MTSNRIYSFALQAVFMGVVVWAIYTLMLTTKANLEARDVESGFDFLSQRAGIPINVSLIDYTPNDTYGRAFLVGIINTIYTAIFCIIFATVIGIIMGVAQVSGNLLVTKIAEVYVEIFRNIPVLLILLFIYGVVLAGLPAVRQAWELFPGGFLTQRGVYFPKPIPTDGFSLVIGAFVIAVIFSIFFARWARKKQNETGHASPVIRTNVAVLILLPLAAFFIAGQPLDWDTPAIAGFNFQGGMKLTPEFVALVVGLSIYRGAFIAENVRAGIVAVSRGQIEAADAMGLPPGRIMSSITLPQALRTIIPATTNDYASLVKDSSLAIAIGFADMVSIGGTMIGQNGQALEVIAIWMAVYLTINLAISVAMNLANSKFQIVER
ncbi:ABC transporter, permease protein (cluster 3, basic aa/glutamine/opines) [hydrothermal vent metagenome]|uniref:ABC transporter, permease protein (Cluster 3, basic aa/glutamine/opines) n=1 Tax=hydrothermal vent metagenome TaxID=652676 RepID=A0A3B0T5W8_9ZZZZ